VFLLAHNIVDTWYKKLVEDAKVNRYDDLEVMHHFTSGMKAVSSQVSQDSLFVIRQSIGGAGYSAWSGIPFLITDSIHNVTVEGDNSVML